MNKDREGQEYNAYFRVKSSTEVGPLAGAITKAVKNRETPLKISAIGAGALNQAMKAVITARGFLAAAGQDISIIPGFDNVVFEGGENRTAIQLIIRVI